ncbi:serine/arginine repetitive matrix protein 2 [Streptomyces sp. URMC 123]|uniref:serine/arginine repetitive matrix protein 2 n=1 Tax=Streptomyces sp. URMC 123 TaxID=3423403 RepID=UPI003F1A2731
MSQWDAERQRWVRQGEVSGGGAAWPPEGAPDPPHGPPPWPPPPPGDAGGHGGGPAGTPRRRRVTALLLAVVLCAGLGVGGWLLSRDDGGSDGADGPSDRVTAAASESGPEEEPSPWEGTDDPTDPGADETPTGPPSDGPAFTAPPSGFREVSDPAGFTLMVPEGWTRSEDDDSVFYTSADDRELLQIYPLLGPEGTPYESLVETERQVSERPGYQRIALTRSGTEDTAPAYLEYAYDHAELGRRRVLDQAFVAPDGVQYAVLAAGPAEDWPAQRNVHTVALASFCPEEFCASP